MRHAVLAVAVLAYALVWGQNWTTYSAALMLAAIAKSASIEAKKEDDK